MLLFVGLGNPGEKYSKHRHNVGFMALDEIVRRHGFEKISVFYDELDLAPGRVRMKQGGGAAGHNGIRSIDAHGGPMYWRVRIGIGHPGDKARVHGYVLSDFAKAEQAWLAPLLDALAAHAPLLAAGKPSDYMSKVAMSAPAPSAEKNSET